MNKRRIAATLFVAAAAALALSASWANAATGPLKPTFGKAAAADISPGALRDMPPLDRPAHELPPSNRPQGPIGDVTHHPDGALQAAAPTVAIPSPAFTFEGPSNANNLAIFGFRVAPPDPVGDVGKNHYVAMVNLVFAVYSKTGTLLLGPLDTGTLWSGFPIEDCTDPSGDPIVVYDELADRWILTQFTTRGPEYFNCVAVSTTGDPTGTYYRFAFSTGPNFPDYPKYGVWPNGEPDEVRGGSLTITTREFDPADNESIGVYAINRAQLLAGDPDTEVVSFNFDTPTNLVGDGLLPADFDGTLTPKKHADQIILGSQDDDDVADGATFDALNVFKLNVDWKHPTHATFGLADQLRTAPFDSIYPCAPTARDCLEQPGVDPSRYLDILSYRQRPTWRLQYRNFGPYETLVTNQSVEAKPSVAGVRWYELRMSPNQKPFIYQQGTYSPDNVHRWMGSVALDENGNMAAGYSVVNSTVFPGIRYSGRLRDDPLGQLTLGEAVLQNGTGSQLTTNSRWGDYTSMNVDPADDCTFYYINEYYAITELAAWQTRIGAFKLPGCA
jgi:hypothetical protein